MLQSIPLPQYVNDAKVKKQRPRICQLYYADALGSCFLVHLLPMEEQKERESQEEVSIPPREASAIASLGSLITSQLQPT